MSLFFGKRAETRAMDGWSSTGFGNGQPETRTEFDMASLAPAYAAIRHITDYISSLPLKAHYSFPDGSTADAPLPRLFRELDDPLLARLPSGQISPAAGTMQWVTQALYGILVHGNAVGLVVDRDGFDYPTQVRWVPRAYWSLDWWNAQWYIAGDPVPTRDVIHIPWIQPSGWTLGLSPLEHFQATFSAGLSAQQYADLRRGGGVPPTTLQNLQQVLDPDVAEQVRDRAARSFASGKPFVMGRDWKFDAVAIPPNQAQFIETMHLTANEIAAIYGVDPREVGGTAASSLTYTTDESKELNRAGNMRPYLIRLEATFNRLIPSRQKVCFDIDATIRTDKKTRFEIYQIERQLGIRSVNEIRALENLPPIGAEGDQHVPPPPTPTQPSLRGNENE